MGMAVDEKNNIVKGWVLTTLEKHINHENIRCGIYPGGNIELLTDLQKIKDRLSNLWKEEER